jgi:uncharacterized protein
VTERAQPHFPRPAPIEAYGKGGFRFAGMSHRGSLLCLPDGIWAWPIVAPEELTEDVLGPALARSGSLDAFILGTGAAPWMVPQAIRERFRAAGIAVDAMTTGAAVRTYNIMLGENRRVGAGLIAVD